MEKVKLPREVAEAIERYWSRWSPEAHLKHIKLTDWSGISERDGDAHRTLVSYAKEHPVEYIQALVNGYEVESAPEDKVRHYYDNYAEAYGGRESIRRVLQILNIKIPGVNASE